MARADAYERLEAAIQSRSPFSFIRLGHCEGKLLAYPDVPEVELLNTLRRQWGYVEVPPEDLTALSEAMKQAVQEADVVGLPFLRPDQIARVETDAGIRYWKRVLDVCDRDALIGAQTLTVPVNTNVKFAQRGLLQMLAKANVKMGLVGCRDLRPQLAQLGVDDVTYLELPEEAKTRNFSEAARHYPDVYLRTMALLSEEREYRVYLVGGGFLGKIYCNEIRKQGSVALDMGSIMDLWAGVPSRSGHDEASLAAWRLSA